MHAKTLFAWFGSGLLLVLPLIAQGEWPQWRGPYRDGSVNALAGEWPGALTRLWERQVGAGYSGPVASPVAVFLHARQGAQEVISRLDLDSGEVQWSMRYPAPFTQDSSAAMHGNGPFSTPALADDRLVTFGITAILSAWDANDGTLLWRKDYSAEFDPAHPFFGAATSPLVWQGLCFVHFGGQHEEDFGQPGVGAMLALRLEDGSEVWRWTGDSGSLGATPVVGEMGGRPLLIFKTRALLVGVEARTGGELWRLPFRVAEDNTISTPLVIGDRLIASDYEKGILAWRLEVDGESVTPEPLWHNRAASLFMSSPVVAGDQVVGFSHLHKGQLFGLDPTDGRLLWQGEGRQGEHASLIVRGGNLLVWREDGTLLVARVTRDGPRILRSYRLGESLSWSHPAIAGNRILIRHGDLLTAWQIPH